MINGKKIALVAVVLLGVGIIGTIFTFNSEGKQEIVKETKTIEIENIKDIKIDTDNSKVELIPTNESKILLEWSGTKGNMDKDNLKVDIADGKLLIQLKDKQFKLFSFDFFNKQSTMKVYLPNQVYQSLEIKSENGRIKVADMNAKEIKVATDNGRIDVNKIEVTTFKAYTNNGRIDLNQVKASETNVETDNGKIILNDVTGKIIGKTDNGAISLLRDDLNSPIELESDNGSITIETKNKPRNALFDAKTDIGRIDVLGGDGRNNIFGNGDNLIKLTTDNGRITVTKTK